MRLDKFLKVSRLLKRRTVAKELCDQGRVELNGRPAKASSTVSVGDLLTLHFGTKTLTVRVERVTENARKEEAGSLYTVVEETRIDEAFDKGEGYRKG
ncbi:RNA-binding S4 domain-containing protein [Calditerricola satsumensis]|uniref:RQC P-site tRNA stabilizing factor n=1 Tax=Calditerricola satsumensis TaxID=373054 RepID=A0A8J3BG18_9BACI|nr:RNA-binding S4 domain-containing protein [Calditerricola satsumensis]GGK06550.1 hypothetical protein GCM10007043_20770 [Calditerricola satsumensis]